MREIGWAERLQGDLFCVEWDIKPLTQSVSQRWVTRGAYGL